MKIIAFLALTLAYIVPNNNPPWSSFQSEFLAVFFAIFIGFLNFKKKSKIYSYDFFILSIIFFSAVGYLIGISEFGTYFYVGSLYLFSSLIVFHVAIENKNDSSYFEFFSYSLIFASIISFGLQLIQFFDVGEYFFPWVLDNPEGGRYFGNLGQPNQMASLLLMSFVCSLYLNFQKNISNTTQIFLAIVFGVALSLAGSKTSALSLVILIILLCFIKDKKYLKICAVCTVSFFVFNFFLQDVVRDYGASDISTGRFSMWKMLIGALDNNPIEGYGFNNTIIANFDIVNDFPENWNRVTAHSHNLIIDFLLWFGIPLGVLLSVFFVFIFFNHFFLQRNTKDKLISYTALPLLVHSMLEFPLHYAYFLIPIGFVIGTCWKGNILSNEICLRKFILFYCLIMGFFISKEYFELENGLTEQRFFINNFENSKEQNFLSPLFLDLPSSQFNFLVKKSVSYHDVIDLEKLVVIYPTYRNFYFLCDFYKKTNNRVKFNFYYYKALDLLNKNEALNFKMIFESD